MCLVKEKRGKELWKKTYAIILPIMKREENRERDAHVLNGKLSFSGRDFSCKRSVVFGHQAETEDQEIEERRKSDKFVRGTKIKEL